MKKTINEYGFLSVAGNNTQDVRNLTLTQSEYFTYTRCQKTF